VASSPPEFPRRFTTPDGAAWEARVVAAGRPSPYLARRLAGPLVEFRCAEFPVRPRTYARMPGGTVADLSADDLLALWSRARPH
jgi:hypothetical protein